MANQPPRFASMLSQPFTSNNFIALQSALLNVGSTSSSVTFTLVPSTQRTTFKLTNRGNVGAYLAGGTTSATAVISSSTPSPTSGPAVVSNCDYIGAGAILTQDYTAGTLTIAAITAGTSAVASTILEISIGDGQ